MDELLTVKSTLKKLKDHNNELEKKFKEINVENRSRSTKTG